MTQNLLCPICLKVNKCQYKADQEVKECWCMTQVFTDEIFQHIPESQVDQSCICSACLRKFAAAIQGPSSM